MAANVRKIKTRIGNIEDIRQITKAMNAIAMTKLTRMKRRLVMSRSYMERIESFIAALLAQVPAETDPHPLVVENGSERVGILILNSDRGLCGRFKGDLNRKGEDLLKSFNGEGRILAGGEKARSFFSRRQKALLRDYAHLYEDPTPAVARQIASDLISLYLDGSLGRVVLVMMSFVSDLVQRVSVEEILPIKVETKESDMLIEPNLDQLLDFVLPFYLQGKIYAALVNTKTSEHAIRLQAMKSATDNANDLLKALTRSYNKARQQSITREIADIMGGAEALRER